MMPLHSTFSVSEFVLIQLRVLLSTDAAVAVATLAGKPGNFSRHLFLRRHPASRLAF